MKLQETRIQFSNFNSKVNVKDIHFDFDLSNPRKYSITTFFSYNFEFDTLRSLPISNKLSRLKVLNIPKSHIMHVYKIIEKSMNTKNVYSRRVQLLKSQFLVSSHRTQQT